MVGNHSSQISSTLCGFDVFVLIVQEEADKKPIQCWDVCNGIGQTKSSVKKGRNALLANMPSGNNLPVVRVSWASL